MAPVPLRPPAGRDARRRRLAQASRHAFRFGDYCAACCALARPGLLPVSVVVPSCDYGRYMQARLASIFAQTYPVRRSIVLDDASTDDSVAVAERTAAAWGRHILVERRRTALRLGLRAVAPGGRDGHRRMAVDRRSG